MEVGGGTLLLAGLVVGLLTGLFVGEVRLRRTYGNLLTRGTIATPDVTQPKRLMEPEEEAARAIAPPSDLISAEEIDNGAQALRAMAQSMGKDLTAEEARHQATMMLMQDRDMIEAA
jgi:hypothetical protein